jgi:DNA repair exonuclease SbcCD ATPase subunit
LDCLDEAEQGAEQGAMPPSATPDSGQETVVASPPTDEATAARPQPACLEELNARRAHLRRELAACRQIEAQGDYLRSQEAHLLRRRDVLGTACELLQGAIGEFGGFRLDRFAAVVGEHLEELTAGRYGEVRLTADFDIQLGAPDGQWQPLSRCSGAMRHVAQLAVRLALAQHLAGEKGPPLLLDDVLTILDKKRRTPVLKTLERLSAGRQVVLCSHDESLRRRAGRDGWQVVNLGMAQGKTAGPGKERNDDDGQLSLL